MTTNSPSFDHLLAMSDAVGTFEHADHAQPRRAHGYCTDDMARVLIAVARHPNPERRLLELARLAFRFLIDAQGVDGKVRNRRDEHGRWHGSRGTDDCWGRSTWAFGTAARLAPERWMRETALAYFDRGASQRSPWIRSMAFAALGAADVLAVAANHRSARALLTDSATLIGPVSDDPRWPWPEPRLSYANAAVAEALIAAGSLLERPELVDQGCTMLRWLLERESVDGHLSPTPVGGAEHGDASRRFDQQPIEVAAMADACARAASVTGDPAWIDGIDLASSWFAGDNDSGAVMWDDVTGGGFDGLELTGANRNEGTESTLALISVRQHAERLASSRR